MKNEKRKKSLKGLVIAMTVLLVWGASLYGMMILKLDLKTAFLIPFAIVWQTFLYTGLFITAHDAMHGSIFPANRKVNNFFGHLSLLLYALFSFKKLQTKHWDHHKFPASTKDPDYHDGEHPQFWRWYWRFMTHYLTWYQILGMAVIFNLLLHVAGVAMVNIFLFWVAPALLSTVQLFYFGTYLTHSDTAEGFKDKHRARSNDYPLLLSFLTCYHFGYHWEHHAFPNAAWWELPGYYRERGNS